MLVFFALGNAKQLSFALGNAKLPNKQFCVAVEYRLNYLDILMLQEAHTNDMQQVDIKNLLDKNAFHFLGFGTNISCSVCTLKPIFHRDAKPFVLGTFVSPNAKKYQHIGIFCVW